MFAMRRTAYPRPELERKQWENLCGEWEFDFDFGRSGKESGVLEKEWFDHRIEVPFCPESRLSGIGYRDFIPACWYRRKFESKKLGDSRLILNFEAVCHKAEVFVNGKSVGTHTGSYTPFSFDITEYVADGENTLAVYCESDVRDGRQPSGKQSLRYASSGCHYTRSTGIWQPVWLEKVPAVHLEDIKLDPDIENSVLFVRARLAGSGEKKLCLEASLDGKKVGKAKAVTTGNYLRLALPIEKLSLWSIETPTLYDLDITVSGKGCEDKVHSYFGMRKIGLDKTRLLINGKPVFMRLVLDQGYYPESVYTAPTDDAFTKDIKLAQALGFNGARLHQRVFERRFIYEADRNGYLVWGEYASWGFDHTREDGLRYFLPEWMEAMDRDYNHPALIGWCPLNETWDIDGRKQNDEILSDVYLATKRFDPTRPCIDTSGNYHVVTDIYDIHDYCQDIAAYHRRYDSFETEEGVFENMAKRQSYGGQPYFLSEYGGIRWTDSEDGWGYGDAPKTLEEYVERYCSMIEILRSNPRVCGVCYTQLYDVEQECNGIYRYDRTPKFDSETMEKMRKAMADVAACEK